MATLFGELVARARVAASRRRPGDPALRRAAVRAVTDLQARGATASVLLLRASLTPEASESLLREAAGRFAAGHHHVHHAAALVRLGDPAGAAALAGLGVRDPARLAGVPAP